MVIARFAPAKVNLALHVVGRRADGYHLLDTLVTFAAIGDRISVAPAETLALTVDGAFAAHLDGAHADNLVMRAARLMRDEAAARGSGGRGADIRLTKSLPVASGIGGGSADAAATLLALNGLWDLRLDAPRLAAIGLQLGADVPMCLAGCAARVTGIGEAVAPAPALPGMGLILVNPRAPVATPAVFRQLARRDNAPMPELPGAWTGMDHLVGWLSETRNDLEPAAMAIAPAIAEVLAELRRHPACRLARMSGSGATCFGLFEGPGEAAAVGGAIARARPEWWVGW